MVDPGAWNYTTLYRLRLLFTAYEPPGIPSHHEQWVIVETLSSSLSSGTSPPGLGYFVSAVSFCSMNILTQQPAITAERVRPRHSNAYGAIGIRRLRACLYVRMCTVWSTCVWLLCDQSVSLKVQCQLFTRSSHFTIVHLKMFIPCVCNLKPLEDPNDCIYRRARFLLKWCVR